MFLAVLRRRFRSVFAAFVDLCMLTMPLPFCFRISIRVSGDIFKSEVDLRTLFRSWSSILITYSSWCSHSTDIGGPFETDLLNSKTCLENIKSREVTKHVCVFPTYGLSPGIRAYSRTDIDPKEIESFLSETV